MPVDVEQVVGPIEYVMSHIDGAIWAADFLHDPPTDPATVLSFGQTVVRQRSYRPLTNALVEAGIMGCRRSLSFLGVRVNKSTGDLDVVRHREPDDACIEQLGLTQVSPAVLCDAPPGPASTTRQACALILRSADKGVAHLTIDRGERAFTDDLRVCAQTTLWAIEQFVHSRLNRPLPRYKVWTAA